MAGFLTRPTPAIFTLLILFLRLVSAAPIIHTWSDAASRASIILPLHHHAPKMTSSSPSFSSSGLRRNLQRSDTNDTRPNARMRLYDDLLLNGYYTTKLWIGTPPQRFSLIVDTGSSVTYVPCSTCDQCGKHENPRFDPELSITYQPTKCNIDCTCDNEQKQCVYERQYAEMSSSSGVLGEDLLSFGNLSELPPQRAVFGCENSESGDLYSQRADGIMGLGSGENSVVDQLVEKGIISDSFSLCYGGMGIGGGSMVLGSIAPPAGMVFANSDPVRSPYYNIDLKEIHVAGNKLALDPKVFDEKHGTILDSGTTYSYLPEPAFLAFKESIMKALQSLKQIPGPDPKYSDICFLDADSNGSDLSKSFPVVDMVFGNGQKLSLTPENYLFRHSKLHGAYCLGIFQSARDPTTLLGGIIVRNTLVMYDRENMKIGFWKTNCSEIWEKHQIPDSPPPIETPSSENSLTRVSPTPAPNREPDYALPDDYQVGQITFRLSFNISSNDLEPHITSLAGYIATELDVYVSQVQLLSLTSDGNNSLIGWAIVPAAHSNSVSHTTALSIIAKISKRGMHLPDNFSNYDLVGWNVIPREQAVATRKWWQYNSLRAVLGVFVFLIIGFSVFGIWFIWRRPRAINTYTPVNGAGPEHELQSF